MDEQWQCSARRQRHRVQILGLFVMIRSHSHLSTVVSWSCPQEWTALSRCLSRAAAAAVKFVPLPPTTQPTHSWERRTIAPLPSDNVDTLSDVFRRPIQSEFCCWCRVQRQNTKYVFATSRSFGAKTRNRLPAGYLWCETRSRIVRWTSRVSGDSHGWHSVDKSNIRDPITRSSTPLLENSHYTTIISRSDKNYEYISLFLIRYDFVEKRSRITAVTKANPES